MMVLQTIQDMSSPITKEVKNIMIYNQDNHVQQVEILDCNVDDVEAFMFLDADDQFYRVD